MNKGLQERKQMRNMGKEKLLRYADELMARYPQLLQIKEDFISGYLLLEACYNSGGKVLIAGNGGSAADAEHIAAELMKRFRLPRPLSKEYAGKLVAADQARGPMLAVHLESPLTAIPLVAHAPLSTAYLNDVDGLKVFAQQLLGFGRSGDAFIAISTSGNSKNILNAAVVAKASDIKILALTGAAGGELSRMADVSVKVPETEAYMVQELHLPVYHSWCMMLEDNFFGKGGADGNL